MLMHHLHVQAVGQDSHQGREVDHQDLGDHSFLVRAKVNIVIFFRLQNVFSKIVSK